MCQNDLIPRILNQSLGEADDAQGFVKASNLPVLVKTK